MNNLSEFYTDGSTQAKAPWVIPQNDKWKIRWDILIMVILLVITMIIPVRLAFEEEDTTEWLIV